MTIAASLCLDMECPQWYNKDDIVHLPARALREKAAVPVWRRGKHMTQGDERMKAAKASIRQRLTHSKLPMLVLVGVVLFALIFLGMRFFTRYTREELYRESQNQLTEITSQMYEKLSITLEQQWDFLTVMDRSVAFYAPTTQEALVQLLQATQNQLMSQDSALRFLAIDESGNLINAAGERMPCEFIDTLGMTGRQCFLIRGRGGDENQMVFSLPIMQPLTVAAEEKSIRITHLVLLKGMSSLTPFFRSSAFHTQNSTYVVISDGVKMYSDAADENINFLGRNIYPALRTLRYPHAGNFDNCLTELEASDNHFTCTDVLVDKTQYFLCMKRLTGCDWTMLFLVPGVEVAAGARAMVDSITLIVNIAFFVLLLLTVGAMYFLLTAMQNRERYAVETENAQALAQANAELDRARQAAVDALKLAESANVSKTAFLTNMSHDIRTPMNAIIGLTNLMQHDLNNPEKLQAYIDKLHTSSEHLLGLINDVLDMSKIESGAVTLRMDEVNLAEQIEQIEAIIRPQTRQRGQHFIVRASQIHHENFIGDATRLRQVLLNILSNAVKYTQQGGEISLDVREVSRSGHSYVKYAFVVKDNGIGMTEEFQKHLFDVFTRAEDSVTNKVQGTGLGMAISKSIVDMMGGVINVESAPGEGSRFEVLLEFKVDAQADDRAHTVKDCRLLLVGYAPGRVADVQDALEHTPVTAEAVERPEDAVSILRQEDVDVVLLSCQYRAPEMLRPLVRQMREAAGKPIFVFCMQAGQREEVLDIISACGLDGFVPLPFFLSNLENEMAKLRTEFGNIGNVDGTSVLNGMRLLCAEDNPLNAEILEELLHMQGATCTIYSDGKQLVEAFDHVRPSDYDVILMDVQMPVMNGYEATRALRASDNPVGRTIPIIAMTANAFADDIQQSLDAGMDMHLSKPIDIAVLEKTLSLFRTDKKNHGRAVFKRRVMEMEK